MSYLYLDFDTIILLTKLLLIQKRLSQSTLFLKYSLFVFPAPILSTDNKGSGDRIQLAIKKNRL